MNRIRIALVLFLLSGALPAQEAMGPAGMRALTLDEIERAAMLSNPEIHTAVLRVSILEAHAPAAGALDDPMFMYRDWGTPLRQPWDLNQAQHMLMLQQTLPGRGIRGARSDVANSQVEAAKAQIEVVQRDISLRVRKAFYDLLRNHDDMRLHDQQAQLARQALEAARIKYTVGRVPQQDVLKAQIAITRLEEHLVMVDQDGDLARAELNALMGRSPDTPLEIVGEYTAVTRVPPLSELEQLAIENRPELKAVSAQQRVDEKKLALARKAYTPDYTVAGGYMLMPDGAPNRNNYMAEFTVNLPWLNRRKHDAEVKEAQATTDVTHSEFEAQKAAAFLEIEQALIRVRAAQRNLNLYRNTLRPQVESTFKAAAAAYEHDRTDFLNLIDSQNMMLDVQSSYYRSAAELDARVAELERAIGTALPGRDGNTTENGQ